MKSLATAFLDTWDIFAFKISSARGGTKVIMVLGVLFLLGNLLLLTHIGTSIRLIAGGASTLVVPGSDQTYSTVVLGYLRTFTINDSIYAVSGVLVAMLGSLMLIPLSGYSYAGVIPSGDLLTVRRNDYHLITDSIVLQFASFVAIIQIFFLTFLSSIITISAQHPGRGMLAGWGMWAIVVLLTSSVAWTFEFLHRRFGAWSKYLVVGIVAALAGTAVLIWPTESFQLFGVSPAYTGFVNWLDTAPIIAILGVIAIFLGICLALLLYTQAVGNRALGLQEKERRKKRVGRLGFLPDRGRLSQTRFLLSLVLHQRNIFRPLVFAVVSINASVLVVGGSSGILYALPAILPLIVSLSWGVNTFGIIGGGTSWLVSQPNSKRTILYSMAVVQLLLIAVISSVTALIEIFVYHLDWMAISTYVITTVAVSAYMTRSALEKAVKGPERYKVHIRGEQVLPIGKALFYVARFFVGAGLIIGLMIIAPNLWVQLGLAALIVAWSVLRLRLLVNRWVDDPDIVQNIIATVGY